jgi:epsilon-lactone hydrolase
MRATREFGYSRQVAAEHANLLHTAPRLRGFVPLLTRAIKVRRAVRGPLRPTWSVELEALATVLHHYSKSTAFLPVHVHRRAIDSFGVRSPLEGATHREPDNANGVPVQWFRRAESAPDRVLVYLHGGGYGIGSVRSHTDIMCRLCAETGGLVLGVDYRLAPEYRFPAQLEDALTVYRWLLKDRKFAPERVILAGESAGGALTISTMVAARDQKLPLPAAAVCLSPWVDLSISGGSMITNEPFDYLNRRALRAYARRFARAADHRHPLAAPLHADLNGLPPLLVHAGGAEVLFDQAAHLARRARDVGVRVQFDVWPDMFHAFHLFAAFVKEGREAISHVGDFVRTHT